MKGKLQIPQKKSSTKHYDEVADNIRKLLTATGASFIPELCEALAKDWYPGLPKEQLQDSDEVRRGMISKILDDWCKDYNPVGIWKENSINVWLPEWLRDPQRISQWNTRRENRATKKYSSELEDQKIATKLAKIADIAPTPPKTEYIEDTTPAGEEYDIGLSELREYGGSKDTPLGLYAKINTPARELFKALTQKEIPHLVDDLVLDYLKPSREFRSGVFYEVDNNMRVSLYNVLTYVRDAIDDTLQLLDKSIEKPKNQHQEGLGN